MAKLKLNPVMEGIHGAIGDLVFRLVNDKLVVGRKPDPTTHPPTAAQTAVRDRFKLAAVYGKAALADPAKRTLYDAAAKAKGVPVFSVAIADFFNAPAVDEIDLSAYTGKAGETIRVRATDDFEVVGVGVAIRDTGGSVIEQGPATLGSDGSWSYQTTHALTAGQNVAIEVTATDRPGHKGTKTQSRT
jgi:hypothetical protein